MHNTTAALPRGAVLWRAWLLAICGLCVVALVVSILSGTITASEGLDFQVTASGVNGVARIEGVKPNSAAARSGLRNGDLLRLDEMSVANRYRVLNGVSGYEQLTLVVSRHGVTRSIAYTSGPSVPMHRWDLWLFYAGCLWMLSFAALIAWRRPDSDEAHVLSLLLALFPLFQFFTPGQWVSPSPFADIGLGVVANAAALFVPVALLAMYALLFARPASLLRRVLAWLSYAVAALAALVLIVPIARTVFGFGGSEWLGYLYQSPATAALCSAWLLPLICVLATIPATRGAERERILWTTLTLGVLYLVEFVITALDFLPGFEAEQARFGYNVLTQVINAAWFLTPIGMTYALLNRRLLDIGFAINRAAVFTGVSVIIVGIFVLVEWALSVWFSSASHTTNLAISAALALALGLSVRAIHSRVDRVLDAVFFRKRHEDEQAIRTLAREAVYITDPDVLLARVTAVLEEHADATGVQILLDDDAGHYGEISENDPAIVRLRTTRSVLDLHDVQTAMHGEFAYPMLARGRLIGALVLGPKRSGESYAPDESDAIAQLAHDAGVALDALSVKHEGQQDALVESITALGDAMRSGMRELSRQIASLAPDVTREAMLGRVRTPEPRSPER